MTTITDLRDLAQSINDAEESQARERAIADELIAAQRGLIEMQMELTKLKDGERDRQVEQAFFFGIVFAIRGMQ